MRSNAPPLLPIFRSRHQAELLAEVLAHPGTEFAVSDLARRIGVPLTTLLREAQRLIDAELLRDRKLSRNRLVSANTDNPDTEHLAQLVVPKFGPRSIVAEHFAQVDGVKKVIIFGSWAARFAGLAGPPPNDIDVLLIGDGEVSQLDAFAAADRAQERIGIDVSPVLATPQQWAGPSGDPLLIQIQHAPYVVAWEADDQAAAM